jgi:uncharacterized membrane protein
MLALSLGINVLLGGAVVRFAVRPPGPPLVEHLVDEMAAELPEADAAILRAAYEARRAVLDRHGDGPRGFHEDLSAALRREPFDPAALEAVFTHHDQRHDRVRETIKAMVIEAATQMSPAGREALARFRP